MNMNDVKEVLSNMVWKLDGAAAKFHKNPSAKWQVIALSKPEVEALLITVLQQKGY
jgi:hypothetical protein